MVFKERYTLWQWLGISILTFGFLLFFKSQISNLITSQGQYLLGSGLVILGAISWAIYALAQKELLQSLSSSHIMLIVYGGCALLLTPFAKITTVFTLDLASLSVLIFCGLNTLIAYGAFAESFRTLPSIHSECNFSPSSHFYPNISRLSSNYSPSNLYPRIY